VKVFSVDNQEVVVYAGKKYYRISDKLVDTNLFERYFCCNLSLCFGQCCVQGNGGAPLELSEVLELKEYIEDIKPYLSEEYQHKIDEVGISYSMPEYKNRLTPYIENKGCAYTYTQDGICKCAIEKAYRDGVIPINKPISCHLSPIEIRKIGDDIMLRYEPPLQICISVAIPEGTRIELPVFRFLKDAIVRGFGQDFYADMETLYEQHE
jgi:hypothetical protein